MPQLVIEKGRDKGQRLEIHPGHTITIGRDSTANLVLGDTMASRLHFKVFFDDGYWIKDLGSMNGTIVNGKTVAEQTLHFGDLIQVGETVFTFVEDDKQIDPMVGKTLSGYKVLERVGRGGMGVVYRAHQLSLNRDVALKVVLNSSEQDEDAIEGFVREARAAAALNHPNVVQVYDVKVNPEGICFFSMEFLPGGSVQDRLSKESKLAVDEALLMGVQAARGLAYAQKKGIVHRDIKPDNLMLDENQQVKIGDMGLARSIGDEDDGQVIGTPHYIAPERVRGKDQGHAGDVYSLGATLYRMISGKTPFSGGSVREIVARKVKEDPAPISTHVDVPEDVEAYVMGMMDREVENRPAEFGEIAKDLEQLMYVAAGDTVSGRPATSTSKGIPSWVYAVGAVALVLIIVAFSTMSDDDGKDPGTSSGEVSPSTSSSSGSSGTSSGESSSSGEVSAELEELGKLLFESAQKFERGQMNPDDPSSIQQGVKEYTSVLDKASASSWAEKAERRIDSLKMLLTGLEASRDLQAAAAQAKTLIDGFAGQLDQGIIKASVFGNAARAFESVPRDFAGTEEATRAQQWETGLKAVGKAVEKVRGEFDNAVKVVDAALDRNEFVRARELASTFKKEVEAVRVSEAPSEEFRTLAILDPIHGWMDQHIRADVARKFHVLERDLRNLLEDEELDAARRLLNDKGAVFRDAGFNSDVQGLQQEIVDKEQEIADRAEAARRAEEEKKRQAEMSILSDAAHVAWPQIQKYRFDRGATAYASIVDQLSFPEYKKIADRRARDLNEIATLFKELIRRINNIESNDRDAIKNPKVSGSEPPARLHSASVDDVTLTYERIGGEVGQPWQDLFGPIELARFIRSNGWSLSDRDYYQLALLYREFAHYDDARKLMEQVKDRSSGSEKAWATDHLKSLGVTLNFVTLEGTFDRHLETARFLIDEGDKSAAREVLSQLRKGYKDTQYYKVNRNDDIRALWLELLKR